MYLYKVEKGLKYIATWTLILLISMHYVGLSALYGVYELDQQLFIELFCENTDKPEMHCNGSCMLSKMNEQEPSDAGQPIQFDILQFQMHFYNDGAHDTGEPDIAWIEHPFYYSDLYSSLHYSDVFRPPILI